MSKVVAFDAASDHLSADVPLLVGSSGLPPKPDLSLGYLPARSSSALFEGTLLDYLPVQVSCKGVECNGTLSVNGPPSLGLIDPAGNQHASIDYTAYYGQLIATSMIDPTSAIAQGSTLIEEDYWQLLWSVVVPAGTPFATDQAVTSGITETDTTTFSYTLGAKLEHMGTGGLEASLTNSFQHAVAITNQDTTTYKFQWPQRLTEATVGVYQLMQAFWVQPGSNLMAMLSQLNAEFGCSGPFGFCLKFGSDATFAYPTSTYLQAATTPPRINILGINEIKQLIQRSISISPSGTHKRPHSDMGTDSEVSSEAG
jgi:hypothetical protein